MLVSAPICVALNARMSVDVRFVMVVVVRPAIWVLLREVIIDVIVIP